MPTGSDSNFDVIVVVTVVLLFDDLHDGDLHDGDLHDGDDDHDDGA